ncbi:hypothetical protein OIU79_003567 [Salix purpurea]|uniref:Uncharacterized protein n=1 Tax=Salix purpurea TaxID=77065 RepID=A0A9Q0UMC7_SALPP|nr:hypothetical protein OIU79_003567 [Salix purpurea]
MKQFYGWIVIYCQPVVICKLFFIYIFTIYFIYFNIPCWSLFFGLSGYQFKKNNCFIYLYKG